MNPSKGCINGTTNAHMFQLFVPEDLGIAGLEHMVKKLKNHFDLVITAPRDCQSEDDTMCDGTEITAIQRAAVLDDSENWYRGLLEILRLVWDGKTAERAFIENVSENVQVHGNLCDTEQESG